jgi:hypothetical protein
MKIDGDDRDTITLGALRKELNTLFPILLSSGSSFSQVLEKVLTLSQDEYRRVDAKGYDFESISDPTLRIEQKSLTQNGVKLSLSCHYGAGRKLDKKIFEETCLSKDFLIADHVHFRNTGQLKLLFLPGKEVASIGHSVSYSRFTKLGLFE